MIARGWALAIGVLLALAGAGAEPPEMVRVPAGPFLMGTAEGEPSEGPPRTVRLKAFWIDRLEVSNAAFAAFVAATGHRTSAERRGTGWVWDGRWREVAGADWRHPHGSASSLAGLERHPVVQVSWEDAKAYCGWRRARLPTEAEWEKAARGTDGRPYPWGWAPPREGTRVRASYGSEVCCRADAADGYLTTAPVGAFPAGRSPYGAEDMAGNVWEWVEDWFAPDFYRRAPSEGPLNRTPSGQKVIRGGGWGNNPYCLRVTYRHANPPDYSLDMVGFRCARDD